MEGIVEVKIRDPELYADSKRFYDQKRKLGNQYKGSGSDDHRKSVAEVPDSEVLWLRDYQVGRNIKPKQWRIYYDIGLCARLGLYCYNSHKGTDYKFESLRQCYTKFGPSFTKLSIILEAMDPADSSPLTFETILNHADRRTKEDGMLWWETCVCRVKDQPVTFLAGSKEAYHKWDNGAIDARYKGEMPKWLSDDDQQQCYVVQESELQDKDNWWLHLFTEIAFYTKWHGTLRPRDVADCLPLETQKVVVETRGEEAATEPREKLKAANAVFYISFECGDDPPTGEEASYRAVVRKTMDGKPGHMRLEDESLEWESEKNETFLSLEEEEEA